MTTTQESQYKALLEKFGEAWNNHDVVAIMSMMTDDCVFVTSAGSNAWGEKIEGQAAVTETIATLLKDIPDARWHNTGVHVFGDRGLTEWRLSGTTRSGVKLDVDGVDVFSFRDGKIHIKNALRKTIIRKD